MQKLDYFIKRYNKRIKTFEIIVESKNGINPVEISKKVNMSLSTVDQMLRSLYFMGLVNKRVEKNHINYYFVTKEGLQIAEQLGF